MTVHDGEETGPVYREVERTGAAGEFALCEDDPRTERDRAQTALAWRDELGEGLRRALETDDAGVGEVVGDRVEVLLLGRHAGGGSEKRAIHGAT